MPFLILGNKIDVASAASEDELRHALGLASSVTGKGKVDLKDRPDTRPVEIFMCSVVHARCCSSIPCSACVMQTALGKHTYLATHHSQEELLYMEICMLGDEVSRRGMPMLSMQRIKARAPDNLPFNLTPCKQT